MRRAGHRSLRVSDSEVRLFGSRRRSDATFHSARQHRHTGDQAVNEDLRLFDVERLRCGICEGGHIARLFVLETLA